MDCTRPRARPAGRRAAARRHRARCAACAGRGRAGRQSPVAQTAGRRTRHTVARDMAAHRSARPDPDDPRHAGAGNGFRTGRIAAHSPAHPAAGRDAATPDGPGRFRPAPPAHAGRSRAVARTRTRPPRMAHRGIAGLPRARRIAPASRIALPLPAAAQAPRRPAAARDSEGRLEARAAPHPRRSAPAGARARGGPWLRAGALGREPRGRTRRPGGGDRLRPARLFSQRSRIARACAVAHAGLSRRRGARSPRCARTARRQR